MTAITSNANSLVTYTIKIDGSPIPDTYSVRSISVDKSINKISSACVVVNDGSVSQETFEISSSDTFIPGNKITIEAGYNTKNDVIFEGIVTGQAIRINNEEGPVLEITCKDNAIKMTVGRKNNSYNNITDSEVISTLINETNGVGGDVEATQNTLPQLIQKNCTDWDFLLARAQVNGLLVTTLRNKVSVFKPNTHEKPALTIAFGLNMVAFDATLNAISQVSAVKARSWDYKKQNILSAEAKITHAGPGNLSSEKLAEAVGVPDFQVQTSAPIEKDGLQNWAQAKLQESEYAKITGEVKSYGVATIEPGQFYKLDHVGNRFSGNHIVSGVHHQISEGSWFTDLSFGLSADLFTDDTNTMAPTTAGLLPGTQGLHNAIVKQTHEDPESQFRVLVDLPLIDPTGQGIWARLSKFYSSNNAGAFFLPEIGDEVLIGFLDNDPSYPIILGSLYSDANKKPYSSLNPDDKNSQKGIVTKSNLRILFDDKNRTLSLITPAGNHCVLDDENQQVEFKDQHNNTITLSDTGISLQSQGSINLAGESVVISGDTGVTVSSSGDVSTSAVSISLLAQDQYEVTSSTASINGDLELTLNASMININ